MRPRGYFGIGMEHPKKESNLGTLWRSASNLGAGFIFTIGARYRQQASDTVKAWRHIPLYSFTTLEDFRAHGIPYDCQLIGVEIEDRAVPLARFAHPERCVYLLGAEDHGLTKQATAACQHLVVIPSERCLNVAVAGAIVMYDRATKQGAIAA